MNFVDHTARVALEELARVGLDNIEQIETTPLDNLAALIAVELEDRQRRVDEYAEELPF